MSNCMDRQRAPFRVQLLSPPRELIAAGMEPGDRRNQKNRAVALLDGVRVMAALPLGQEFRQRNRERERRREFLLSLCTACLSSGALCLPPFTWIPNELMFTLSRSFIKCMKKRGKESPFAVLGFDLCECVLDWESN